MHKNKHISIIVILVFTFLPINVFIVGTVGDATEPSSSPSFGLGAFVWNPNTYFFNDSSGEYELINSTIVPKDLTISGRSYEYGVTEGNYYAYFRETSSDVKDRPVAMVKDNYTLTFTPVDYVLFEPHKGTTQGKVGNRVQSDIEINNNKATYPGQYTQIGNSNVFADLTYTYQWDRIKEDIIIDDKSYLQDRFDSQCNPEDYNITNVTFDYIIRAYDTSDEDANTLGIVHGNNRTSFKEFGLSANGAFTTSDRVCFTDENNETVYFIPFLYAYDSDGNSILLNKTVSMTAFGNLKVSILVPYDWLNETAVFPVYVDPTYGIIADGLVDSWEFDEQECKNPSVIKLGSDGTYSYFAIAQQGDTGNDNDGHLRTIKVFENNGTIVKSIIDTWEFDTSYGYYPYIFHVNGDTYGICYNRYSFQKQRVITVNITSTGDIDDSGATDFIDLTYNGIQHGRECHVINTTDNVFVIFYVEEGTWPDDDMIIETIWINSTGTINDSVIDTMDTGEPYGNPGVALVDDDTVVIHWDRDTGVNRNNLTTLNISHSGDIGNTFADNWEIGGAVACGSTAGDIMKIADNKFLLNSKYYGWSGGGVGIWRKYLSLVNVSDDGVITKSTYQETEYTTDTAMLYSSLGDICTGVRSVIYIDTPGGGGMIKTFNSTEDNIDTPLDSLLYTDAVYNRGRLTPIINDYYLLVWCGTDSDGYIGVCEIFSGPLSNNNPAITASSENPLNQSTNVGLSLVGNYSHFNISITDDDGDTMNITWSTNESGIWQTMGANTSVNNGTYYCTNVSWVDSYSTTYWWNVSVDDGNGGWDNNTYYFTTTTSEEEYIWIDITNESWDLGNIVMGSVIYTNETTETFIADMDNTTVNTDLKLQITTDGSGWSSATGGNSPDTNIYRLDASIDTWSASDVQIVTASATTISTSITAGNNETFDLRFRAPTVTTTGDEQTITITASLVKH